MSYIPEDSLNWLKIVLEQDENMLAFLIKNYSNLMNLEKFDKQYLEDLITAIKLIEQTSEENNELQGNELSLFMEQSIKTIKFLSAAQNSYINEFTQKIVPSLKAFREEITGKKLETIQFKKTQDILMKKQVQRDNEVNPAKQQKLFTQCANLELKYKQESEKINNSVKQFSSERVAEYKALFMHMIYYSMQLHAKCLEELTTLNSQVESFDEEKFIKKTKEELIEKITKQVE